MQKLLAIAPHLDSTLPITKKGTKYMFNELHTFTPAQLKNAAKLRDAANKKLQTMEYGNVTLKKVKNLSHSDVEEIYDAMVQLVDTEQDPYYSRLAPSSEIKQVYLNAGVYSN